MCSLSIQLYAYIDKRISLRTLERLWAAMVTALRHGEVDHREAEKRHEMKNEKVTLERD